MSDREPLKLTEEEILAIRRRFHIERGEAYVEFCPLCAQPDWRRTETTKPDAVVGTLGEDPCYECSKVATLHPTIFAWVVNVVGGQRFLVEIKERK